MSPSLRIALRKVTTPAAPGQRRKAKQRMTAFHLGTRRFVVVLKRSGGQSLFSATLTTQTDATSAIDRVRLYIIENPRADLKLTRLGEVVGISARQLSRLFRVELGMTPAAFVEQTRTEEARRLLECTTLPIKMVSHRAGFGSMATLRRAFHRRIGVSPLEYRRQLRTADDAGKADTKTAGGDAC